MLTSLRKSAVSIVVATSLVSLHSRASAQLTLTTYAQQAGFQLTTFAYGFPNESSIGPLGIVFPDSGGVLVADWPGNVRLFPTDTDGQNANNAPVGKNYGMGGAQGLAQLNGHIYMTQEAYGTVTEVHSDGTDANNTILSGLHQPEGIVADPFTGHLFVSDAGNDRILDVDPIAKTYQILVSGFFADGLALSNDGRTLYAADIDDDTIRGFRTSDGTQVFQSMSLSGLDGTAIGIGKLAGLIFANTNYGQVWQVNLQTGVENLIASGGSRGDFVAVDSYNGSLMLTQTDSIARLIPPASFIPPLKTLTIKPKHVKGGSTTIGTVTIGAVSATDEIVTISSSNASVAMVPATVVVPAGHKHATFTITTAQVTKNQKVIISGTAGSATKQAKLKVKL